MVSIINIQNSKKDLDTIIHIIANDIRRKVLIPYFGAGLSNDSPSNNLLTQDIKPPLIKLLVEALSKNINIESVGLTDRYLEKCFKEHTLERIIDSFYDLQAQQVYKYLSILDVRETNDNHKMLAILSANKLLPFCITVNFDTLFEQAAEIGKCNIMSVVPLIETLPEYKKKLCDTLLIKPHGSFVQNVSIRDGNLSSIDRLLPALSQIGNSPHQRNIEAFRFAFDVCESLLVMGYGQRDWDVWPIVDAFKERVKRLYWVFYRDPGNAEKIANVLPGWAKESGWECYAIIGDIAELLYACLRQLGIQFDRYTGSTNRSSSPNTGIFCDQLRSAVAAINLIPESMADTKYKLYKNILNQIQSKSHIDTMAVSACYSQIAWSDYVRWDMKNAFRFNKKEIQCIAKLDDLSKHEKKLRINRAMLTRGYIYLGKVKLCLKDVSSHNKQLSLKKSIAAILYCIVAGLYYIRIWIASYFMQDSYVISYAGLQWNSLVHLIVLRKANTCKRINRFTVYLLRHVAKKYMNGVNCANEIKTQAFFDREYFELRSLEAELIAKPSISRLAEIERRVSDLHTFLTVTKNGHIPQVYLCQSLIIYNMTGDLKHTREWLLKAYNIWRTEQVFSGIKRVEEIARYLKINIIDGIE